MIFVTVGMHHQGFNRLIRAMDAVAQHVDEKVVMQIGSASYEPQASEWFRFAADEQINQYIALANTVVAHAGAGTIINTFQHKRPLVVVPRRLIHKEHVDDHQLELACALASQGKISLVPNPSLNSLLQGIRKAQDLYKHEHNGKKLTTAISQVLLGDNTH